MNYSIPQYTPHFTESDARSAFDYVNSGGFLTEFRLSSQVSSILSEICSRDNFTLVPNGTLALELAAMSLGLKNGDHILIPNYTMFGTYVSFRRLGIKVSVYDIEQSTLFGSLDSLQEAFSVYNDISAFVVVPINGRGPLSASISDFFEFAKEKNVFMIEDAAQALGSRYVCGAPCGSVGHISTLSFSPAKIISCGQGGAVGWNDDFPGACPLGLKDFARKDSGLDIHVAFGTNFKFTDLQSSILLSQLSDLNARISRKIYISELYSDAFAAIDNVFYIEPTLNSCPWFYEVLTDNARELELYLKALGIGTRRMYPSISSQPCYDGCSDIKTPVSFSISNLGTWLPSSLSLSDAQVNQIASVIDNFKHSASAS